MMLGAIGGLIAALIIIVVRLGAELDTALLRIERCERLLAHEQDGSLRGYASSHHDSTHVVSQIVWDRTQAPE